MRGLEVSRLIAEGLVERGLMVGTAVAPVIGYDTAATIAKEALASGRTIRDLVLEQELLDEDELDELLDFHAMTEPEE